MKPVELVNRITEPLLREIANDVKVGHLPGVERIELEYRPMHSEIEAIVTLAIVNIDNGQPDRLTGGGSAPIALCYSYPEALRAISSAIRSALIKAYSHEVDEQIIAAGVRLYDPHSTFASPSLPDAPEERSQKAQRFFDSVIQQEVVRRLQNDMLKQLNAAPLLPVEDMLKVLDIPAASQLIDVTAKHISPTYAPKAPAAKQRKRHYEPLPHAASKAYRSAQAQHAAKPRGKR